MMPQQRVGEVLVAHHRLRLQTVVEHQVLLAVVAQAELLLLVDGVAGGCRRGRLPYHLALVAVTLVPHLYGVAVAPRGGYG